MQNDEYKKPKVTFNIVQEIRLDSCSTENNRISSSLPGLA
jgi:hypothetical protein